MQHLNWSNSTDGVICRWEARGLCARWGPDPLAGWVGPPGQRTGTAGRMGSPGRRLGASERSAHAGPASPASSTLTALRRASRPAALWTPRDECTVCHPCSTRPAASPSRSPWTMATPSHAQAPGWLVSPNMLVQTGGTRPHPPGPRPLTGTFPGTNLCTPGSPTLGEPVPLEACPTPGVQAPQAPFPAAGTHAGVPAQRECGSLPARGGEQPGGGQRPGYGWGQGPASPSSCPFLPPGGEHRSRGTAVLCPWEVPTALRAPGLFPWTPWAPGLHSPLTLAPCPLPSAPQQSVRVRKEPAGERDPLAILRHCQHPG